MEHGGQSYRGALGKEGRAHGLLLERLLGGQGGLRGGAHRRVRVEARRLGRAGAERLLRALLLHDPQNKPSFFW